MDGSAARTVKTTQERSAKKSLKTAILHLQALDTLLNGVFARDDEPAENDGFPERSTGGGGSGKGSHSDRTSDHATRDIQVDPVHADVVAIVNAVTEIRARAAKAEKTARKLTAHDRSVVP